MKDKAKRILTNNLYITLATASATGEVWSTPVFYALDDAYCFYWYSRKDALHSQNISNNSKISASLYATSGEDKDVGVYIKGTALELEKEDIENALEVYAKKTATSGTERKQLATPEDFLDDAPLRMYKLTIEKIYISGEATKWKGKWIDTRIEITL